MAADQNNYNNTRINQRCPPSIIHCRTSYSHQDAMTTFRSSNDNADGGVLLPSLKKRHCTTRAAVQHRGVVYKYLVGTTMPRSVLTKKLIQAKQDNSIKLDPHTQHRYLSLLNRNHSSHVFRTHVAMSHGPHQITSGKFPWSNCPSCQDGWLPSRKEGTETNHEWQQITSGTIPWSYHPGRQSGRTDDNDDHDCERITSGIQSRAEKSHGRILTSLVRLVQKIRKEDCVDPGRNCTKKGPLTESRILFLWAELRYKPFRSKILSRYYVLYRVNSPYKPFFFETRNAEEAFGSNVEKVCQVVSAERPHITLDSSTTYKMMGWNYDGAQFRSGTRRGKVHGFGGQAPKKWGIEIKTHFWWKILIAAKNWSHKIGLLNNLSQNWCTNSNRLTYHLFFSFSCDLIGWRIVFFNFALSKIGVRIRFFAILPIENANSSLCGSFAPPKLMAKYSNFDPKSNFFPTTLLKAHQRWCLSKNSVS